MVASTFPFLQDEAAYLCLRTIHQFRVEPVLEQLKIGEGRRR